MGCRIRFLDLKGGLGAAAQLGHTQETLPMTWPNPDSSDFPGAEFSALIRFSKIHKKSKKTKPIP